MIRRDLTTASAVSAKADSPSQASASARSVYIETAGCSFNVSDSEAMAGVLRKAGYSIAAGEEEADVIVLNTCTVKDRTILDFRKRFAGLTALDESGHRPKPLVVAGCIPKADGEEISAAEVSTIGPDAVGSIAEVVTGALEGRAIHRLGSNGQDERPALPIARRNPVIEILPIASGCLSGCTFCQTRLARGKLASFRPSAVLDQARRALDEGVREFWVTAQDTGAYGREIGYSIDRLLGDLLRLPGDFRVRLGMTSPRWIAERLDALLDVFDDPRMFQFLHVPVQSGSEAVVEHMRRDGTASEFEAIHAAFVARFPEATVMTDIIVGYPTETEADFQATLDLLSRARLPAVNCSRFSARPGTAALRLEQHHSSVIAERSRRLVRHVRAIAGEYHKARVGRRRRVLIDEANADGSRLGRTQAYRPVLVREPATLGSFVEVEILRGEPFRYFGRCLEAHKLGEREAE